MAATDTTAQAAEAPEGVSVLAWDGDALRVETMDGADALTLRFSFEAIAAYEARHGSVYGVLDDLSIARLCAFLGAFAEPVLTPSDAFAWYGKLGHARAVAAVAYVVERLLVFAGMRPAADAPPDPNA